MIPNRLYTLLLPIMAATSFALLVGCSSPFTGGSKPSSPPVLFNAASTNDPPAQAWLELARQVNTQVNPTPTRQPIDTILGAGIAIAAALGGWFARHKSGPKT